jgi:hypothetical protein
MVYPSVFSSLAIADALRFQLAVSTSGRFRPARVSE